MTASKNPVIFSRIWRSWALVVSGCIAPQAVLPQTDSTPSLSWTLNYDGPAFEMPDAPLIPICLFHDATSPLPKQSIGGFLFGNTRPPFRHGWKAYIGSSGSNCEESLRADIPNRVIYIFPWPLPRSAGVPFVPCPRSANLVNPACNSSFMKRDNALDYMIVDPETVNAVVTESNVALLLNNVVSAAKTKEATAEHQHYLEEYGRATSLDAIHQFEETYRQHDPDQLIVKLAPLKTRLESALYRDEFARAQTSTQLSAFVQRYESSDTEGLVPEAKVRLAAARMRELQEEERSGRTTRLSELEDQIRNSKADIVEAQRMINQENEAGAISGYVNKTALMRAGEAIVLDREVIDQAYREYRRNGGTKALAAIR